MIRIAMIDDHLLFLEGIQSMLDQIEGLEVVIATNNDQELLRQLKLKEVDLLLLDLEIGDINGIDVFHEVKKLFPQIKVVVLSMHNEPALITNLMKEGVNGYLLKETQKSEFEECIKCVFNSGNYFNDTVSKAMLSSIQKNTLNKKVKFKNHIHLTARELDVLNLITEGLTSSEIAEKLFLSPKTIEGHRKNLLSKFDVKNVAGLLIRAIKEKIIDIN